ncbi:MAG: hypothetical protein M3N53_02830 [Actinomycetota bacterium]|nr:hypothetical protein [Actinomycetota bacterium]
MRLDLAGPIEISMTEIILALVILTAMALAVPVAAGAVAVILYRRRTPVEQRNRRDSTLLFFKVFSLALVAQAVLGVVIGWISELMG